MSDRFDRLLLNPDEACLNATGWDAFEYSGFPLRARHWNWILHALAKSPEGRVQLDPSSPPGQRYVSVAWWTDYQGRKHVRVTAGDFTRPGDSLHYSRTDDDERPPLWHICPERLFRVKRGNAVPTWLACCACGEVGVAKQLGWAGDCCGPCHDRREEGMAGELLEPPLMLFHRGPINGLAFSPPGSRLAVSVPERAVFLHDLKTNAQTRLYGHGEEGYRPIYCLRFTPDGEGVAGADQAYHCLRIWATGEAPCLSASLSVSSGARVSDLIFSPGGRFLACVSGHNELRIWESEGWWKEAYLTGGVTAIDFAPDGRSLAVGRNTGTVRLLEAPSWSVGAMLYTAVPSHEDIQFLKFTPDGSHLVLVTGSYDPTLQGDTWSLRLWGLRQNRQVRYARIPLVSNVEMTPEGRYLAWIVHDDQHSPAAVHFWDLQRWQSAGWLEWDPEDDLHDLAFSPDGQTLATGSANGVVKLWPWRLLLEG